MYVFIYLYVCYFSSCMFLNELRCGAAPVNNCLVAMGDNGDLLQGCEEAIE